VSFPYAVVESLTGNIDDPDLGTSKPGVVVRVFIDLDTLDPDLAAYDPSSATSPSVTTTREYVRAIFDAVLAARKQP
jgi:hypothetical protein